MKTSALQILCLVSSAILIVSACSKSKVNIPEPRMLTYEIDCNNCFVVYVDADGNQKSLTDQNSSWSVSFEAPVEFPALLAAQNSWSQPAAVTARILFNGDILTERTTYCPISGTVLVSDTIP